MQAASEQTCPHQHVVCQHRETFMDIHHGRHVLVVRPSCPGARLPHCGMHLHFHGRILLGWLTPVLVPVSSDARLTSWSRNQRAVLTSVVSSPAPLSTLRCRVHVTCRILSTVRMPASRTSSPVAERSLPCIGAILVCAISYALAGGRPLRDEQNMAEAVHWISVPLTGLVEVLGHLYPIPKLLMPSQLAPTHGSPRCVNFRDAH